MKKVVALIFAVMMVFSIASCGENSGEDTTKAQDTTPSETTALEETTGEMELPEDTTAGEPETPEEPDSEIPGIIDKLYEIYPVEIFVSTMACDLSNAEFVQYQIGLKSVDKVTEAYTSGPMINAQAYEMALVRVKDAADAEAIAREILEGANPRKWICVTAESVRVAASGDLVLLVMASSEQAEGLIGAFKTVCGGELDLTLKK